MHVNVDGTVLQGMKIEAVMDRRADNISLDLLSRVLVDVQVDRYTYNEYHLLSRVLVDVQITLNP